MYVSFIFSWPSDRTSTTLIVHLWFWSLITVVPLRCRERRLRHADGSGGCEGDDGREGAAGEAEDEDEAGRRGGAA